MTEKQKILACRERLDRTLASPGLSNEDSIKSLVKNQLLRSPFPGTEGQLESSGLMVFLDKNKNKSS